MDRTRSSPSKPVEGVSAPIVGRDPRVDFLRGLSLLSIFVDHIPKNLLAEVTLHSFGFSDAAELFVILAGYSATFAYNRVFEAEGLRVGLRKVFTRCLQIYGVQVALLLVTLLLVAQQERLTGLPPSIVAPMLRDGWQGAMRGVTLRALPAYLDILPLYIVLLSTFPLIRYGMLASVRVTLAVSFLVYAAANLFHWNLPNIVDPDDAAHWYFDPFTWQFVFVLGAAFAMAARRRLAIVTAPPLALRILCWLYALAAFVLLDAWHLWPSPFDATFSSTSPLLGFFGNEPKTYVSPWRLFNVLAITYLALTSPGFVRVARHWLSRPLVVCGQNSLQVFALGCILALLGRMVFRSYGVTTITQIAVNATGLGAMLALGMLLDRARKRRGARRHERLADGPGRAEADPRAPAGFGPPLVGPGTGGSAE